MPVEPLVANVVTITGPLRLGSRGKDVQTLQSLLNKTMPPGAGLSEDGAFGMKTEAAVSRFQRLRGLEPDGVAGPLTAQALGARFVPEVQPLPRPHPPGTLPPATNSSSQAALLRVVAFGAKRIFQSVEVVLEGVGSEASDAASRARRLAKSGLNQCLFSLSTAAQNGLSSQLTANQTRTALLEYIRNLGGAAGELERAGGDASGIFAIMDDLNARIPPVVDTVRKTLEGRMDGGLRAGISNLQTLLDR